MTKSLHTYVTGPNPRPPEYPSDLAAHLLILSVLLNTESFIHNSGKLSISIHWRRSYFIVDMFHLFYLLRVSVNRSILSWKASPTSESHHTSVDIKWTASSEFGTYSLCEQRRFRRACASAQSRQNLCCSLIQAVSEEEPSDRKPDPWPLWMAGHAQLKFVMTECSKTQIRLTGPIWFISSWNLQIVFLLNELHRDLPELWSIENLVIDFHSQKCFPGTIYIFTSLISFMKLFKLHYFP